MKWEKLVHPAVHSAVFWTAVGGIGTAAAAVVAIITLIALRADSAYRTRPVLIADLEHLPAMYGNQGLDLVIRNTGLTAARDLVVKFEPDPLIIDETGQKKPRDRGQADRLVKRFSRPLRRVPGATAVADEVLLVQAGPERPDGQ